MWHDIPIFSKEYAVIKVRQGHVVVVKLQNGVGSVYYEMSSMQIVTARTKKNITKIYPNLPYCYLFKRVHILANFRELGKIANNSIR